MERRNAGRVLEALLSDESEISLEELKKGGRSPFAHEARREILEYLCRHPLSCLSRISAYMKLSTPTTKWHIDKILEGGYIKDAKYGRLAVFYPNNLLLDDDMQLLALLNNGNARKILRHIIETPGIRQNELGNLCGYDQQTGAIIAKKLEKNGFVTSVCDGRHRRYYLTQLLETRKRVTQGRSTLFRKNIMSLMEESGLRPKLLGVRNEHFIVSIRIHSTRHTLTLCTDPYNTSLSG